MAWFYVKEIQFGSIFNYQVKNHLVEINDPEKERLLCNEPIRFRKLNKKEADQIRSASSYKSEAKTEKVEDEGTSKEIEEPKEEKKSPKKKTKSKDKTKKKKTLKDEE